jgi:hypothetical protein
MIREHRQQPVAQLAQVTDPAAERTILPPEVTDPVAAVRPEFCSAAFSQAA